MPSKKPYLHVVIPDIAFVRIFSNIEALNVSFLATPKKKELHNKSF